MDEDLEALRPKGAPAALESWNVEDLRDYVERMRAEITRVEAAIADKGKVSDAAAALFGGAGDSGGGKA